MTGIYKNDLFKPALFIITMENSVSILDGLTLALLQPFVGHIDIFKSAPDQAGVIESGFIRAPGTLL